MLINKITTILFHKKSMLYAKRNIQISIIGASSDLGSNLSLLLKQNSKIKKLVLYDDDPKVNGIAMDLSSIPGGPEMQAFDEGRLSSAVRGSDAVVMVSRVPRKPHCTREEMVGINATPLLKLCVALSSENPDTIFAIASNPINSLVPFASALMYKYGRYNPFKMFGITEIDSKRARSLIARNLKMDPQYVSLPVIGGHSDETVIPLFSNMQPATTIDLYRAQNYTRSLRKAGTDVIFRKRGQGCATLAVAGAVCDFVNQIVDALGGNQVIVNSFTANPNFGTKFFAGPTKVGSCGIIETCSKFQLNDFENHLVMLATSVINRDTEIGENHIQVIEMSRKF